MVGIVCAVVSTCVGVGVSVGVAILVGAFSIIVVSVSISTVDVVVIVNKVIPEVSFFAIIVVAIVVGFHDSVVGHGIDDWSSQVEIA